MADGGREAAGNGGSMNFRLACAIAVLVAACPAQAPSKHCAVTFSVVRHDTLGNTDVGLSKEDAKWYAKNLAKKYPDICYSGAADAELVFDFTQTRAVYHGTRTVPTGSSSTTTGTVTDESGNTADVSATTETDSSAVVPDDFDYPLVHLAIERPGTSGDATIIRRFEQKWLYEQVGFGLFKFGKGVHPYQTLLEEAVKWLAQQE